MTKLIENYWTQAAIDRTIDQTVRNYMTLSTIFYPIIKIGGERIDDLLLRISRFWAAADTGRFIVDGNKYRLKPSGRGFRIVAV